MEVRVPMEMNMGKFSEKLVGLLELAKKKETVTAAKMEMWMKCL